MKASVTVVDYGMGNLLSVRRAFEHCGAEVRFADSARGIGLADRLVLPGVGAFSDGMNGLRERNLVEAIHQFAGSGRPFLGICLGMQMMFSASEEHGEHSGLGLLQGRAVAIPSTGPGAAARKIPHIGWAAVTPGPAQVSWKGGVFDGVDPGRSAFYFVHSFHVEPQDVSRVLAVCDYLGFRVTAAVHHGPLMGCQFHPEKSGGEGLHVLRNFLGKTWSRSW